MILTEPQPYPNHNGGWIGFDPTGMLLIGLGDGGSGGDPENRASDLGTILGKMLRIDVLAPPDGQPYGIPADNPYADRTGARPEILHFGLRNPFRSSIDPATGNLWIGDVGQNAWEEVDTAAADARGLDFGWRRWEGRHCFNPADRLRSGGGHDARGGVRARGRVLGDRRGRLPRRRRSRHCAARTCSRTSAPGRCGRSMPAGTPSQAPVTLVETGSAISSISTGEDGEVYLTDLSQGRVLRLVAGG